MRLSSLVARARLAVRLDAIPLVPQSILSRRATTALRQLPSWVCWACLVLPLGYVLTILDATARDIPFWDEYDSVLSFLLNFNGAADWGQRWSVLFGQHNEHRMIVSRLLILAYQALWGKVDFVVLTLIGLLFIVGLVLTLSRLEKRPRARLGLAAIASLGLLQLQHRENLFWGGSSLDHVLVVLLSLWAIFLLSQKGRIRFAGAAVLGGLAGFSVTQGLAVFPAGLLVLILQRRWLGAGCWLATGATAATVLLAGMEGIGQAGAFYTNANAFAQWLAHWLALLGGVPAIALSMPDWSPLWGALLLVLIGVNVPHLLRSDLRWIGLIAFITIASALISFGRTPIHITPLTSRYLVLSAVAWIVVLWLISQRVPFRGAPVVLLGLAAILPWKSHGQFIHELHYETESRDLVIAYYNARQTLSEAPHRLYPVPERAEELLKRAAAEGLYRVPAVQVTPSTARLFLRPATMTYFIDDFRLGSRSLRVRGWMLAPERMSSQRRPKLILTTDDGRQTVFRGFKQMRPDVAATHEVQGDPICGFYFVVPRHQLPTEPFTVSIGWQGPKNGFVTQTDFRVETRSAAGSVTSRSAAF